MTLKGFFVSAVLTVSVLPTLTQADEVYSCKGAVSDLHFVIYTNGDKPRGGHMYLKSIQTAVLDPYRMNSITIRAKIVSNTAKAELILNKDRKAVYITLRDTTRKVCDATVRVD